MSYEPNIIPPHTHHQRTVRNNSIIIVMIAEVTELCERNELPSQVTKSSEWWELTEFNE